MRPALTRRQAMLGLGALPAAAAAAAQRRSEPFRYCLNTGTIRGQGLGLAEQIDVAARAGYDGVEPWIRDLHRYEEAGGRLEELRRRVEDAGLVVESAIGFAQWIVEDPQRRAAGLEAMRRDMDAVRRLGGRHIAAPPAGAARQRVSLEAAAQRYRALLELGQHMGVTPQLELWGGSQTLRRIGELLFVAAESGRPDACLLPDVYHIYKGGSDFAALGLIHGPAIHVFHVNDYPADPPRETITDADRVYPGDGVAPLSQILQTLHRIGFRGALSLELFNRQYWRQDALAVARTGLEKMRAAVRAAGL